MSSFDPECLYTKELCICDTAVTSGIRPAGRTVDQRTRGRPLHAILFIRKGQVRFQPVGTEDEILVSAGEAAVIPQGAQYFLQYMLDGTSFVLINFRAIAPSGEPIRIFDRISVVMKQTANQNLTGIMSKLEAGSTEIGRVSQFRRKELIYRLLSMIFEEESAYQASSAKFAGILPGVQLLRQTFTESLPITHLAKACGISVSSFRSLFTAQFGMSPIRYRTQLRINQARKILMDGSCTVTEAAYASGFDNISYFCRCYKKLTGETPRETRLKYQ